MVRKGTMPLPQLSASLQSLPPLPTSKSGPSGAHSQEGGFVYALDPVSLSNELSCGVESFFCHWNHHRFLSPEVLRFSSCVGALGFVVCLTPQLFLPVYPHANVGSLASTLPTQSSSHSLVVFTLCLGWLSPPVWMNVSSLTPNSLVVGLPYSSILWQFLLLFFFLSLFLSFFCLCKETKCIFLYLHLGQRINFYSEPMKFKTWSRGLISSWRGKRPPTKCHCQMKVLVLRRLWISKLFWMSASMLFT